MHYVFQTNLTLLTPHLTKNIMQCANDWQLLKKISFFSSGSALRSINGAEEKNDEEYKEFYLEQLNGGPGFFGIFELPEDLESQLLIRLPKKFQNCNNGKKIKIRLQILQNFKLFPHIDKHRNASILTMVSNNDVSTTFWDCVKPHEFIQGYVPDSNLIEERLRVKFNQGESWLFDSNKIHGTTELSDNFRVTINYGFNVEYSEMIKLLIND